MEHYFEIIKYAQCENLRIEVTSNNAYLGANDVTLLSLKDENELEIILKELSTTKYKDSNLMNMVGEIKMIGLLLENRELFECPFTEVGFEDLENEIREVLKFTPYLCIDELLEKCKIYNANNLSWYNEFLAPEYVNQYSKLTHTLNQKQIRIKNIEDAKIFLNVGDILSVIDTDDYYEECYFKPKQVRSEHYRYKELTTVKYEILKNIISDKTKLVFEDKNVKSKVFGEFLSDLTYSVVCLNYKDDLSNEYFNSLHEFANKLAMADLLS